MAKLGKVQDEKFFATAYPWAEHPAVVQLGVTFQLLNAYLFQFRVRSGHGMSGRFHNFPQYFAAR